MNVTAGTFELGLIGRSVLHNFTAFVPDGQGGNAAEHSFEWRADSTALALDLEELARAAVSGQPPENNLHITFGQQLYSTVFAGEVRQLWNTRLTEAHRLRQQLRLVLRIDPRTARPLLNLPWEYLHDGNDFLALNWRTPLSRMPWALPISSLPPLDEPLRLLVIVAAPLGLSENLALNTSREEDLILSATSAARRMGKVRVEFTQNGSPEALDAALREIDPHILHFTGHGLFVPAQDTGVLLMERAADGLVRAVTNDEFASLLERRARSLRLVFLSACQSAVAARNDGYDDLVQRLLEAGIPSVLAMQFNVLDKSAMALGSAFYKSIADGDAVDVALTVARVLIARESPNGVDFAVPTLGLSDPNCLQVVADAATTGTTLSTPLDLTGLATAQNFVGRGAVLRELQTKLDPERGNWRAAIVYGLGGIGKTVLAARLAERMASRLDGVKSIRITPMTTARDLLDQLSAFLLINQAHFSYAGIASRIADFNRIKDQPLPLESKVAVLADILRILRLLLIFDNCEDILPEGRFVSRADLEQSMETSSGTDPDLFKVLALLLESVSGPTRFLFTSRVDFSLLEAGRLTDAVGSLSLSEMGFRDAVFLMETVPPLDRLPVVTIQETHPDVPTAPQALTMRDIWEHLGGHPYTLNLFARHSRQTTVEAAFRDLQGVRKQLLEFTLLERAIAQLPEQAKLLLRRGAVYEEPIPLEALAYLVGDERDAMPDITDEVKALLNWGLLSRPPGSSEYLVHTLVRAWARAQWEAEERLMLLHRAAHYWLAVGRESNFLVPYLNARHYFFAAGDYQQAGEIVHSTVDHLVRLGQMELAVRLMSESVRTLQGEGHAYARSNLASLYRMLGNYDKAREEYEALLTEFTAANDRQIRALNLYNLGTLCYFQGEYRQAREYIEQALSVNRELGDQAKEAQCLQMLGVLHHEQGDYGRARERHEQALAINKELGDRVGLAGSLHELGVVYYELGERVRAREHYEQALAILQELGDRSGTAVILYNLGRFHQNQGEYERAHEHYRQSLTIVQELGDRAGVARCLHQLGVLHELQGEFERARERHEHALTINQELGNRAGVATDLHCLGSLYQLRGEYERAREFYEQSLAIKQEIGDRVWVVNNLCQLALLYQQQGEYVRAREQYEQAIMISQEVGNRVRVANCLHRLGLLHQDQGEYEQALERFEQSLTIAQELNDPVEVASNLAQIGLLLEQKEDFNGAVDALAHSVIIFQHLGSPQQRLAAHDLDRLREKMGEQAFAEAWQAAWQDIEEAPPNTESKGITAEEMIQVVVTNTVCVLTDMPDQKHAWLESLSELYMEVKERGPAPLVVFLDLMRQLVGGTTPQRLTPQMPAEFSEVWDDLLRAIVQQEK